jgi:hypothetical protein
VVFPLIIFLFSSNRAAVALTITTPDKSDIPRAVTVGMVLHMIHENNIKSLSGKRAKSNVNHDVDTSNKRNRIEYDHRRARMCFHDDWMGPIPRFPDKLFEHTFQIIRSMVDMLVKHLAKRHSVWQETVCHADKPTICPYIKFLITMKMICFGVFGNALMDYFQMGETTTRRCVCFLMKGLVNCCALADIYLRRPSRSNTRKIVALHERVHKIPGTMGSLDVTKVHWKRCPTAWKGKFQGREKFPSIGLKAVADNNLWFWHAAFGFPGTLNDINIWERSSLYESMINGRHDELDFDFLVDGVVFNKLFYLVDGIYPQLTCFLLSESDPHTKLAFSFAQDQESHRKDVEQEIGVLKLIFLSLMHPINLHHKDNIYYFVLAVILMHNMMVEARVENDEVESANLYNTLSAIQSEISGDIIDDTAGMESLLTEAQDKQLERHFKYEMVMKRWASHYDCNGVQKLKTAMMRHLYQRKHGFDTLEFAGELCEGYNPRTI